MSRYTIGIDTGGTYTDAVIIDKKSKQIMASAKALTTRGDLSIGIVEALENVLSLTENFLERNKISTVCLSTTLATNALIEGHGSTVGVFLIGFDDAIVERSGIANNVKQASLFRIDGGHLHTGEARHALALDQLETALNNEAANMDAYAVTARYATRNFDHERRVQAFIRQKTGRPVCASVELSNSLNDPLRALTATLNAKMISLISSLVGAVKHALKRLKIDADLMLVKGDGSIGSAESAVRKPIETILSGPAASVIGGQFLTGLSDFALADIGGTSTDIAIIKNSWPTLLDGGTTIGGVHTLVRAVDVRSVGLGGDSEVSVNNAGQIQLSDHRVVPISLVVSKWPEIKDRLVASLNSKRAMNRASQFIILPEGSRLIAGDKNLSDKDQAFLARLDSQRPRHYYEVVHSAADRACLSRLQQKGMIERSELTPSDAAHVLGLQSQWSVHAAKLACEILGRATGAISGVRVEQQCKVFAQNIVDAMVAKSSKLMIESLADQSFSNQDAIVGAATHKAGRIGNLNIALTPAIDIVAVGGPAAVFYPEVGKRLGVEVIIPDGSDVANAIGAAISMIKIRSVVEITYGEHGGYLIHHRGKPETIQDGQAAIDRASQLARDQAEHEVQSMGGYDYSLNIEINRIDFPGIGKDRHLMAATITAEVVAPEINIHSSAKKN